MAEGISVKIISVSHGLEGVLGQSSAPRSPGLHVSDLYNSLYRELEPARYGRTDGPNTVKMALGLAWEAYLEEALLQASIHQGGFSAVRPDEQTTPEGIAFSPDLIIFEKDQTWVGEIKVTWMTEADSLDDPKFGKWLTQVKTYCHHLGISRARFYVLFVNGNYRDRRDPSLRAYDVEFSARELTDNWTALCNHGRHKGLL